jgi:hypothetical protein
VAREEPVAQAVDDQQDHVAGRCKLRGRQRRRGRMATRSAARFHYGGHQVDESAAGVIGEHRCILGVEFLVPMRHEIHLHADIPILEGVSRRQLELACAPLIEYLDADSLADVKSLEPDEPGIRYDEKEMLLAICWTGEIGRSFDAALDAMLENIGPYCYEAVEVDLTVYLENGEQESRLLFVGPTAQAIHEAQRRCMLEDVAAILGRQFDKADIARVAALVNELFDNDWKDKASQQKKPERAFESYTRPSRKNLH